MGTRRKPFDPAQAQRSALERKERDAEAESAQSGVYVIGPDAGPMKVGVAIDPRARLSVLQTGCPETLSIHHFVVVGRRALLVEAEAHRILAEHHVRGEWFDTDPATALQAIEMAIVTAPKERAEPIRRQAPAGGRVEAKGSLTDGLAIMYAREQVTQSQLEAGLAYREVRRAATSDTLAAQGRPYSGGVTTTCNAMVMLHKIEGEVVRKADVAGLSALMQIAWRGDKTIRVNVAALRAALDVVGLLLDLHTARAA